MPKEPMNIDDLEPAQWAGLAFSQAGKIARLEAALRSVRLLARRYEEMDPAMVAILRVVDDVLWDEEQEAE